MINTFDLVNYLDVPGQLDYFPTCNLGVSRTAFEAVGGFASVRSGGDADLCWRIQRSGHGRLAADRRVLMSWQPRSSLRQLVEQTFRYGKGHSTLLASYAPQESVSQTSPAGPLDRLRERLREHPHDMPAVLGSFALALPLAAGRLVAARERHR